MSKKSDQEPGEKREETGRRASAFPLVGLGASAGGIKALQTFFEGMPADSGMAFVVVMHLAPDHESSLTNILQQRTSMPVTQITDTVVVEPDHVYVIPPYYHLSMQDDKIHLIKPQQPAGRRVVIDLFFRTLSVAYGPRAVCIVLSGTDSDGAIGIKHVKEQGGLTIAQDPADAEFDSMPRSAIQTGMVDWVLPVAAMPGQMMEFMRNEVRMHIPPEETPITEGKEENRNSGGPVVIAQVPSTTDENALAEALRFLRGQTGHDFSHYKRATVLRRVARRLQVNLLEDIPSYLDFLRTHPAESTALLHDLLISVTNFFRDAEAFRALENHIPQLFMDKTAKDQVRVWVAGCATGEEAYSVAMLLCEHAARLDASPSIQVFATDLDEDVIQIARAGLYPTTIEADVSPERLRRFFDKDSGRYRIKKQVREKVLFSPHNLLRDSPFSRLDLVTCRNLLIYLKHEAQEAIFDLFHFALRPGALMFLGSSENVADSHAYFAPLDKRHRIYVRRAAARAGWQIPAMPGISLSHRAFLEPVLPQPPSTQVSASAVAVTHSQAHDAPSFGQLHLSLLEQFAPPSLIINLNYDIVHLSEHVGRFLEFSGDASMNLLNVVNPALRMELRTALFRVAKDQIPVTTSPLLIQVEGVSRLVTIHVRPAPVTNNAEGLLLVVFEPTADSVEAIAETAASNGPIARHLEEEIQHLRAQLSVTVEQYEASLEELKASNEELQAMNEETRSTAEELETSKEELQSINEELTTVNQELNSNVIDLSRANGDLQNLMASTDIGTIFLDRQLHIKRFTPRVQELFNLIPSDIGRPLTDITHKLNYEKFADDVEGVLKNLHRSEREVPSGDNWFLARMLPYRTLDDHIDGVVLTFVDITERKSAEATNAYLAGIVQSSDEAIVGLSPDGMIESWNPAAERLFDYPAMEILGKSLGLLGGKEHEGEHREIMKALRVGKSVERETVRYTRDRRPVHVLFKAAPIRDKDNQVVGLFAVLTNMTERRRAEAERHALERETILWQERTRISQELHDTLAQVFTAIKLQLDAAEDGLSRTPEEASEHLARARELARDGLVESRRAVNALRTAALQAGGLAAACEQMTAQMSEGTDIRMTWAVEGEAYSLPATTEGELFRIAQEALTNAIRHAQAQRIDLRLRYTAADIQLSIIDDGQGFNTEKYQAGFGILGIQERVQRIGGAFTLSSEPGKGTELLITVPKPA